MDRQKIIFMGLLGAVFFLSGLYYRIFDPARSDISYEYLGIGTWSAGIIFYILYPKYKEFSSFILGLLVLHAGVLLLLKEKLSNPKLLGALVFTAGVIVVLSSGFSDYMKKRKAKK
ncbi:hypothetical protein ANME2D_00664 [Candidatus Methanoperedens nitroreducens]|uniref:Uncharacterized protein n=1 Tax=Candidatus Methanoperedens nitratireducens TaxID=1392998 RepID=A0A062VAQ6_9EURY|nr:hypothetical protein [Candidatus Methanoperedens nitroreducens]KCZ73593.1 hypothetical protein ANME2D_00664 [Candidatus Methanoperedens nitroreducens]MDJ1422445.1 hypothetical protein [Candidatus Methanoperedens sp.]